MKCDVGEECNSRKARQNFKALDKQPEMRCTHTLQNEASAI